MFRLDDYQIIYPMIMIFIPLVGLTINALFYAGNVVKGAKIASFTIGVGLIGSFIGLSCFTTAVDQKIFIGLKIDALSLLMSVLILFVSFTVHQFSRRYMSGDRLYRLYFLKLTAITLTAMVLAFADNLLVFWISWIGSNCLLVFLMIHKSEWLAAKNSGILALKTLLFGSFALLGSFLLMYKATGSFSITHINEHANEIPLSYLVAIITLLILSALVQSAQWPFHRWLSSSLNSPTPVSALMHAGLVNGGGFVLVRFAPLLLTCQYFLTFLFIVGSVTVILGTLWKLVQPDIKRMLANSTIAQMGFMMMQCGLGLFSAAVAHLCWHGLFKAYLFLNAGSALNAKKRKVASGENLLLLLFVSCLGGFIGALSFAVISEKTLFTMHPSTFLVGFAFISAAQLSYACLRGGSFYKKIIPVFFFVALAGIFYGEIIHLVETFLAINLEKAGSKLTLIHFFVFGIFFILWLVINLKDVLGLKDSTVWSRLYVSILNGSQPHPKTITASRKSYQF